MSKWNAISGERMEFFIAQLLLLFHLHTIHAKATMSSSFQHRK